MQVLVHLVQGWDSVVLTSPHVVPMLCICDPHFEEQRWDFSSRFVGELTGICFEALCELL